MTQQGKPILEAELWTVGDVEGLSHHEATAPEVPGPDGLLNMQERFPDQAPPFAFWNNLEAKPVTFNETWPPPGPLPPVWQEWTRFQPRATFTDPWVDAARTVILVDVQSWPAASRPHAWTQPAFYAPSLDLYVAFHEPAPEVEWLLLDGYAPAAADGLMGWTGRLWTPAGRLVASGGGQLLCRRIPGP
jgi:acyl-CoA thioesterase-2